MLSAIATAPKAPAVPVKPPVATPVTPPATPVTPPTAPELPPAPNVSEPRWFGLEFREKVNTRNSRHVVLNLDFTGKQAPSVFEALYRRGRLQDAGALQISPFSTRNRDAMSALRDAITGSGIDQLRTGTFYRPKTDGPKVNVQLSYEHRPFGKQCNAPSFPLAPAHLAPPLAADTRGKPRG